MQKKLIALAVAGLISAPVMAQSSNVQIYGIVDMGVGYLGNGEGLGDSERLRSRTAIDSGLQSASRLGVRGTEDLGNGLTAFFQAEHALPGETSGSVSNRQTFVGLRSDAFGGIRLGRDWSPTNRFIDRLDPFDTDTYAAADDFYSSGINKRYDNAIFYRSPDFQGFQVQLAYSRNVSGDEEHLFRGESRTDERIASITPTYEWGPLFLGASYQRSDAGSDSGDHFSTDRILDTDADGLRQWDVGGAWDFGMVEVSALFGQQRYKLSGQSDPKIRQWLVGASAPVGEAGLLKASYINSRITNVEESTLRGGQWALGYDHFLSQRTNLYAVYAHVNTNSAGEGFFSADQFGPHEDDDMVGAYESAFAVGVRHKF